MNAVSRPPRGLSKSRITEFEQCPKRLWLSVHRPELAVIDGATKARFAMGHEVGSVACSLYPEGIMVEADGGLTAALATTAQLIADGHPGPIFEATFQHDGVLIRADILLRTSETGWHLAEVKGTAGAKAYHLGDLATQVWVLQKAGIELTGASVRHLNRDFILEREGDYQGLFRDTELLPEIACLAEARPALVAEARAVLAGAEPDRDVGDHCTAPFQCGFAAYCSRNEPAPPDWPVTILPHGGDKKWLSQGVVDLLELDETTLPVKQARIVRATRTGIPEHNLTGAQAALAAWTFPRAWLDFETIALAVPRWIGTRPFGRVPFQFSLHLEAEDGALSHHEFLSIDGTDPRRKCAEALVAVIPADATIISYNASFERGVLKELATFCPDLADHLLAMAERTVDLLPLTREHWYHRDQRGSWSIKAVLPTMSGLDYGALAISDGNLAQDAYLEATDPNTPIHRRLEIEADLRIYCAQDTMAMIEVARTLAGLRV